MNSITVALQLEYITLAEVRSLLDWVVENFSETNDRIDSNAEIISKPFFESSVVKISSNEANVFHINEMEELKNLKRAGNITKSPTAVAVKNWTSHNKL